MTKTKKNEILYINSIIVQIFIYKLNMINYNTIT